MLLAAVLWPAFVGGFGVTFAAAGAFGLGTVALVAAAVLAFIDALALATVAGTGALVTRTRIATHRVRRRGLLIRAAGQRLTAAHRRIADGLTA